MTLLFAANELSWIKAIVIVVGIVIYLINHLTGAVKRMQQPPPPQPVPPPDPQAGQAREQLEAELQVFLRRAAEKRGVVLPRPAPSASIEPPRQRKKKKPALVTPQVVKAQTVEEPLSERRMVSSVETTAFEQRADQLTQLGQTTDIESHVSEVFDHQLGQFAAGSSASVAPQAQNDQNQPLPDVIVATEVAALLANPQTLRGAIVLNEILTRPEHFWS